jgi:hypothetical protein
MRLCRGTTIVGLQAVDIAPQMTAWILRQDEQLPAVANLDEHDHYMLARHAPGRRSRWR